MLQTDNNDSEKPESNGCSSTDKPRGTSGSLEDSDQAAIARLTNSDSSHAALREGYDEAALPGGADTVVVGMKESVLETLDKNDTQSCNFNGVSGSKQVLVSAISPDADFCLASTICGTTRERDDDKHLAQDEVQCVVEKIQDCDGNGGSVLEKTKEVFVADSSIMGMINGTNPCSSAVDTPCIVDKGVADMHYILDADGKIAIEQGKRESLPLVGDADDSAAISSQSDGHLLSAEKLDSCDQVRPENLDSAVLIESSDLHPLKAEAHDETKRGRIEDVDGNQTASGEGLHQSAHVEAALPRGNVAVMVREEDYELAVETTREVSSDPYYFSDGDEQTGDADSKPATTKREYHVIELQGTTHEGDETGSPTDDHARVLDPDGQRQLHNVGSARNSGQVAEVEGTSNEEDKKAANPINHARELDADVVDTMSGVGEAAEVPNAGGNSYDRDKAEIPIDPGGQFSTDASESCAGTSSTEQAGLQDVAVDAAVTRFEVSQQEVAEEATENGADEGDFVVQNPPEILQVYVRRQKRGIQDHTLATVGTQTAGSAATEQTLVGNSGGEPSTAIKYYTRRSHRTPLESLADAATTLEVHSQNSGHSQTASMRSGGKGTPFILRSRNRMNSPAKAVSSGDKDESVDDDYMKPTSKSPGIGLQQNNKKGQESTKMCRKTALDRSSQSMELPDWLPKGWTAEVKVREGGHTAGTKDKYYYDPESGCRFRSKNEVMQYLERGAFKRLQGKPKLDSKKPSGQKTMPKVQSQSAPRKVPHQKTQEPLSSDHLPARMKTTPVTAKPSQPSLPSLPPASVDPPSSRPASDVIPPPVTWAPVSGPNGPIWLPWGGTIAQMQEAQGARGPLVGSSEGMTIAPILSSSDVVVAPISKDQEQKDTENRFKLIFRLKRKDPEQEPRKGKSKRPTYEIIGRENASSMSMQIPEEKQKVTTNLGGGENALISSSAPFQEANPSLMKEFSGLKPSDYLKKMPTEDRSLIEKPIEPSIRMAKHQRPLLPRWNGEQNTAWTALGIPATASASGFQQMNRFSNPNHLFLQHLEIPTRQTWQYPLPPHMLTLAPAPSSMPNHAQTPSVPLPVSAPISAAPYGRMPPFLFSASVTVPSSDYRKRTGAGSLGTESVPAGVSDRVPLAHRTMVQKPLTKVATMKQLEGLGRSICQEGLKSVPQPRNNPELSLEDISAKGAKGTNMVSGVQTLPSSLVVAKDLQETQAT